MWQEKSHRCKLSQRSKKLKQSGGLDQWVPELTGPVTPPRQRPLSPAEQEILSSQVDDWLRKGVIEARRTRHVINNNIVFAAKANGGVRVCDDCTPVNAVTQDLPWPLPRLQDLRHFVRRFLWYSRVDLKDAFFRIGVPAKYRPLTAFTSKGVQYQFRKMPFGVKTGPAVFQRYMDHSLADLSDWLLVYIDDILIGGSSLLELRHRTRILMQRLQGMGCTENKEKSEYEKTSLIFAGIRLGANSIGPNSSQVGKVLTTPFPATKAAMQSALGLVSYLRDFIPLTAHFTATLYPSQGTRLDPDEAVKQWHMLLRHISSAITSLRHFQEKEDADLYADASNTALGAVLIQNRKVVAVASRKLTPPERGSHYSATDREHLALVYAAKKFRVFLHRTEGVTRVWSDHAALIGKRSTDMTPRQVRWQTIVSQWLPQVKHVPGKENPADFFSRWDRDIEGGVEKTIKLARLDSDSL